MKKGYQIIVHETSGSQSFLLDVCPTALSDELKHPFSDTTHHVQDVLILIGLNWMLFNTVYYIKVYIVKTIYASKPYKNTYPQFLAFSPFSSISTIYLVLI